MPPSMFDPSAERPTDLPQVNPWLDSTYLQYIQGVEGETRDWCLRWVQVCRFAWELTPGCELFEGRVAELGIDRLGLDDQEVMRLLEAVAGTGVRIPGTSMKLRVARPWCVVWEPAIGDEPMLPAHWPEGVELYAGSVSLWIGRRVPEQPLCPTPRDAFDKATLGVSSRTLQVDWSAYDRHQMGWKLRSSPPWPPFLVNALDGGDCAATQGP
jgi:hypothetical protein